MPNMFNHLLIWKYCGNSIIAFIEWNSFLVAELSAIVYYCPHYHHSYLNLSKKMQIFSLWKYQIFVLLFICFAQFSFVCATLLDFNLHKRYKIGGLTKKFHLKIDLGKIYKVRWLILKRRIFDKYSQLWTLCFCWDKEDFLTGICI